MPIRIRLTIRNSSLDTVVPARSRSSWRSLSSSLSPFPRSCVPRYGPINIRLRSVEIGRSNTIRSTGCSRTEVSRPLHAVEVTRSRDFSLFFPSLDPVEIYWIRTISPITIAPTRPTRPHNNERLVADARDDGVSSSILSITKPTHSLRSRRY